MQNFITNSSDKLQKNGYKITKPRSLVLQTLAHSKKPLNAYEITAQITKKGKKIDTVTTYRTLELFKKLGIAHHIKESNGFTACTNSHCTDKKHCHHHFICEKCGKNQEIHVEDQQIIKTITAKLKNLQINSHYLELHGLCEKCRKS